MTSRLSSLLLSAACLALPIQVCIAQASAPPSRTSVKAETRVAEKSGQLPPVGEGTYPVPQKQPKSSYTRTERKADTLQARKSGELTPGGEAGLEEAVDKREHEAKSTRTRADRKAETLTAKKAGQLIPAGKGS